MATKSVLWKILKGILHTEEEDKHNHVNMENKLTRQADEQMRSKEESCNTKTAK
jgi:hypothetical protein